jgi:AraC family transcriptional regulator, regulatory protein of adaptative response / methylated-DNA-[protein]-cysteine methyltransferase
MSVHGADVVERICRVIQASETIPSLARLAQDAGLSPHQLHRLFRAQTGVTPHTYARELRAQRLREALRAGGKVVEASYEAGFSSSGRLYADADSALGMTPTQYRSRGVGVQIRFAVGACSLGHVLVAQSERGICAIALGDDPGVLLQQLQDQFVNAALLGGDADFEQVVAQVVGFIEAPQLGLDLPLDLRGTAFQMRVWQALREIPAGATISYQQLAQRLGNPNATRAVARACASNVIAVAIPCHRVVRTDGSLSGYRWGIERKEQLIAREARSKQPP